MEFKGFLNDLEDWEYSRRGKDHKLKGYGGQSNKLYDHSKYTDPIDHISGINSSDGGLPDAASEKELGNEYFKKKKFLEAIECYSRSIALSPTSVAFANRAMAYLKLKRYEEAENDCSEALTLDDRYVKAYSRRATARKELGKLKGSLEDADFAVRLEPNNQELRKQYSETKALYEKEINNRKSEALKPIIEDKQRKGNLGMDLKVVKDDHLVSVKAQKEAASAQKSVIVKDGVQRKNELKESLQDVASRAASRAVALTANNITAPKSAYEFEVSWRALSDDSSFQARLLKMIPPPTLPEIFKNALSTPILVDIIKCIATFFKEDSELAVGILDNMTRVPRFDMIVMCMSARDRSEIKRIWEEIFSSTVVPAAHMEALTRLRSKYCYGEWRDDHPFGPNGWPKER
ncbi:RNA polymerase II-associated protein 3 isoform X2 [Canna indica]|uniref:RNA polymerase II-associated protein 3 isoform X2 n=1 Tax=Canna indica TaxID=4628 RepID=A0AAQ3L171_9LILI|nr:RNA polymerase II-associated protein 3 isoform X2 [Canna indica]